MKYIKTIIAAVLAICLTACSFLNETEIENGIYNCQVDLTGGSGRASVESPAEVVVSDDGNTVQLVWSSPNYDYMIVDDTRYENEAETGKNSVFTIPFSEFDASFTVIADTTAMSTPHEIEYEITVHSPDNNTDNVEEGTAATVSQIGPADLGTLEKTGSMELDYAKEFSVDYYKDSNGAEYAFIQIGSDGAYQYFLIGKPESKPESISDNVTYLCKANLDKTYLVSTSVMDLVCSIDAINNIKFSGTDAKDWYIKSAKEKMKSGDISYAGKYSAPDYELLVSDGCNFAIENTMIYHNPDVKEKLEELGIPVLVERSSYEENPLGRLEWIKLYGLLYNKSQEANSFFEEQEKEALAFSDLENTGKTVAIFSIDSNGMVTIRKPGDYLSKMVDMAGGKYVPESISGVDENALSTIKITMEDFYLYGADADILIYNSTIEGEVSTISELLGKSEVLADFNAVKNDNVYCIEKSYFQQSSDVAEFIEDIHIILCGDNQSLNYVYKLKE